MEFPYQKDIDSPLYEALPMVMLTMANGEVIRLNYFMQHWMDFIPTRYKEEMGTSFIPTIRYHSKFITPNGVMKNFITLVEQEMKTSGIRLLKVSSNAYIKWDCVCKIEIEMQHYVIAFDKVEWDAYRKYPIIREDPRLVTDMSELQDNKETNEDVKKEEEISYGFLSCPELESK